MKILYVIGSFYPSQGGGPSSAISWLVKFVHRQGVDTKVVTTNSEISPDRNIIPNIWIKNEFGQVCYHSFRSMQLPVRMTFSALWQLRNTDIVHLNSIFHPPSLIVAAIALMMRKVIFWDPGGELASEALKYGSLKKHIYLKLVRFIVRDKPYYHTTSKQETEDVKKNINPNARFFEAPNYIDSIDRISCEPKKQFLFLGRFHPIKGIENLLIAIGLSEKFMNSDFSLVIAGDHQNDYGAYIKGLVDDLHLGSKVKFVGHVQDTQKFTLFAESYFFILPSHSENFANVVTESLSQGTPVIASTGTPWKILEDNKSGYYCSNQPEILARAIDQALNLDVESYNKFRTNAFALVIDHFGMEKGVHKWIDAYRDALSVALK
ncbi:MAG: glycosyltransferase [Saprospiraceae bacterium]|nr:glycosyltransferase [Saprospiraceae bacterium]